jgi:hypothetical protein
MRPLRLRPGCGDQEKAVHLLSLHPQQPNYRQPFDILVERNSAYKKEMVVFQTKNDHFNLLAPRVQPSS